MAVISSFTLTDIIRPAHVHHPRTKIGLLFLFNCGARFFHTGRKKMYFLHPQDTKSCIWLPKGKKQTKCLTNNKYHLWYFKSFTMHVPNVIPQSPCRMASSITQIILPSHGILNTANMKTSMRAIWMSITTNWVTMWASNTSALFTPVVGKKN